MQDSATETKGHATQSLEIKKLKLKMGDIQGLTVTD